MKGITFGNYHSFDDFSLLLSSKEIGSPNVKVKEIEIPGADGTLDLTDYFGEAKFENVTHKFQFSTIVPQSQFLSVFANVKNKIHGKKLRVILDDDPSFYYMGRCFVSNFTNEKGVGIVSVECVCEPWKYKIEETKEAVYLYGKNILDLTNLQQGVLNAIIGQTFKELTAYTTSTRLRSTMPFLIKQNTKYTFSFPNETFKAAIRQFDANNVLIATTGWITSPYTFTTNKAAESMAVYIALSDDSTIVPDNVNGEEIQIEEGSTQTEFEEFQTENTESVTLTNMRKRVLPIIKASGTVSILFNGTSYPISYAEKTIPEIELSDGENTLSVTGSGAVLFSYREGGL